MGYPSNLDDIPETQLYEEIQRRKSARAQGVCDYCHRFPSAHVCGYPDRHYDPRIKGRTPQPLQRRFRDTDRRTDRRGA